MGSRTHAHRREMPPPQIISSPAAASEGALLMARPV